MIADLQRCLEAMDRDGFVVLPGLFALDQVQAILAGLDRAFKEQADQAPIRSQAGSIYAARNILSLWPESATAWRQPPLPELLGRLLGPQFGLVRGLFFDKPPDQTWALPWHKDLTIAVREHRRPSEAFVKPTTKAGVPHVEAPEAVLASMATARIHLDEVTAENGPLQVIPGSHRTGKTLQLGNVPPVAIQVAAGDVLLMRPLLAHNSGRSHAGTARHRRILHLEFAAAPELPEDFAWHTFRPGGI